MARRYPSTLPTYECGRCSGSGRDPETRDDDDCAECFGSGEVDDPEEYIDEED